MGLRDAIRNSPAVGVIVAIAAIGLAVMVISRSNAKPDAPQTYYLDLSTNELFMHTQRATPPIDVPGGAAGMGVRATVIGCGSCDKADLKVAYIEKFSPEAIAAMSVTPKNEQEDMANQQILINGRLIAYAPNAGDEVRWISIESAEGQSIVASAESICGNGGGQRCKPE